MASKYFSQPVDAAMPDIHYPGTVDDLLGLFKGRKKVPYELAVHVLGTMPPSAALAGLGLMVDDSHAHAAELHGYIRSCNESFKTDQEIRESIMRYIDEKGYCTKPMSVWWKTLAVGVLIWTVKNQVSLADLRPKGEDRPYLELMTVEPEAAQPDQGPQYNFNMIPNMDWDLDAAPSQSPAQYVDGVFDGYRQQGTPQPRDPGHFMSGGQSGFNGFNPTPSPQLNRCQGGFYASSGILNPGPAPVSSRTPTPHSQYGPTSSSNTRLGSPSPQPSSLSNYGSPSPFPSAFRNSDRGYGSIDSFTPSPHQSSLLNTNSGYGYLANTPPSPTNTLLSPHSPNLNRNQFGFAQFNAPVRSLSPRRSISPLSNNLSNLRMSPYPNFRPSLSPVPSIASRLSTSRAYQQSISQSPALASLAASSGLFTPGTPSTAFRGASSPCPRPFPSLSPRNMGQNMVQPGSPLSPTSHQLFGHINNNNNLALEQQYQHGVMPNVSPLYSQAQSTETSISGHVPYNDMTTPDQSPQHGSGATSSERDTPMAEVFGANDRRSVATQSQSGNDEYPQEHGWPPEDDGWAVDDGAEPAEEVLIIDGAIKRLPRMT